MFLWTGTCVGTRCHVRMLVTPAVQRSGGRVRITREEMKRVGREMRARGEILIVQVHTHPGRVPFSSVDEREAADQGPGALAMVVHLYGQTDWTPAVDTTIYERAAEGTWSPWSGKVLVR